MESVHLEVLKACYELNLRQNEILPHLSKTLQVETNEVFYEWAFRRIKQSGTILNNEWRYFFHGLECDIANLLDGRFLRVDFGPGGTIDTFSGFGILQFIMTSKSPWSNFEQLKLFFATERPPYNQFSGDYSKINDIFEKLFSEGLIEVADKDLIAFEKQYTTIQTNGSWLIKFPPGTPEKQMFDCSVAKRLKLSESGKNYLKNIP